MKASTLSDVMALVLAPAALPRTAAFGIATFTPPAGVSGEVCHARAQGP